MKNKFSRSWISSIQPRKQRKYRANAPLHLKGKFLASHLSPELRKKYNKRSARVRVGDKVKVLRGNNKGKEAKVLEVNIRTQKVFLEKIQITKVDGNVSPIPFNASNLMIIDLNFNDKKRKLKFEKQNKK